MIKIGDKIKCSNGHTYTLSDGPFNTFLLIDENKKEINIYQKQSIKYCLPHLGELAHILCIENDDKIDYVKIIEYIKKE